MPAIRFSVPHQLGKAKARQQLNDLFPKLEQQYAGFINESKYQWHGDECNFSLKVKGMSFSGDIEIEETSVAINLNLPFAAMFFKDKIQQTIQSQAHELLGSGKSR